MNTTLHTWNDWLKNQPIGSLYQTSIWAHFQEQIPGKEKSQLITVTDPKTQKILGGGFLIKHTLPFSLSWLECPRGPVFDSALTSENLEYFFKEFLKKVQEIAKKERAIFLRIDPPITPASIGDHDTQDNYESTTQKLHFKKAHASYFPQTTLLLDLSQTEEEILQQMKPKGRYNIKVAQKHGIVVERVSKDHFNEFYSLITETADRDNFSVHNAQYYKTMLDTLGDSAALWIAYHHASSGQHSPVPVAALIATYFGDTATYYYGASSYEHRNMMAPYLLQWEAMRDAKQRDFTHYDLLGIAPIDAKNHPWQGVTDFKTKFGGEIVSYSPAKEYVFRPLWYFMMLLRKKSR